MKYLISLLIALLLTANGNAQEKVSLKLSTTNINNPLLVELLTNIDKENIRRVDKHGLIKLFEIPELRSCLPETVSVCSYRYYLSVHSGDFAPATNVFFLGELGSIVKITPLDESNYHKYEDMPVLPEAAITVQSYSDMILSLNKTLVRKSKSYALGFELVETQNTRTFKLHIGKEKPVKAK